MKKINKNIKKKLENFSFLFLFQFFYQFFCFFFCLHKKLKISSKLTTKEEKSSWKRIKESNFNINNNKSTFGIRAMCAMYIQNNCNTYLVIYEQI